MKLLIPVEYRCGNGDLFVGLVALPFGIILDFLIRGEFHGHEGSLIFVVDVFDFLEDEPIVRFAGD